MGARSSTLSLIVAVGAAISALAPLRPDRRIEPPTTPQKFSAPQARRDTVAEVPNPDSTLARTGTALVCEFASAGTAGARRDCDGRPPVVDALVIIVPDPLDSHLDWAFDSAIESIRRAYEHADYSLDRYWLPWVVDADSGRRADRRSARLRTTSPGVMLFRSSRPGSDTIAVAYLVGETPTQGIHAAAFQAALRDRSLLLGTTDITRGDARRASPDIVRRDTLRIVGPVFSGSARSLRAALDSAHLPARSEVLVLSGGATATANALILRRCVAGTVRRIDERACTQGPRIRFHAMVNPLDRLKSGIETLMHDRFKVDRSQIAYLVESGTAYGQSLLRMPAPGQAVDSAPSRTTSGSDQDKPVPPTETLPLELPFPINISRLRKDYARQPLLLDSARGTVATRTQLDWRDPSAATESPAATSELTAPMIERTLSDIEQTLLLHRIRAVGVLATDVRDRLFLAAILKERVRDVKLFIIGSHSLYLRPELNETLRGALIVSTYPLFLENQFWDLTHADRQRLVFTSDQSEGIYNAVLTQLGYMNDLTDYAYPMARSGPGLLAPPVWITVVGATSLLPVIAAPSHVTLDGRDTAYVFLRDPPAVGRTTAETRPGGPEHTLLTVALIAVLTLATARHTRRTMTTLRLIQERIARVFRRLPATPDTAAPIDRPPRPVQPISAGARAWWRKAQLTLLLHGEAWSVCRYVAVIGVIAPLSLILFRPREHGSGRSEWGLLLIAVATGVALFLVLTTALLELRRQGRAWRALNEGERSVEADAMARKAQRSQQLAAASRGTGSPAIAWHRRVSGSVQAAPAWIAMQRLRAQRAVESYAPVWQCVSLLLIGGLYLAVTIDFMLRVSGFDDASAGLYFLRTLQLNSGVTSALPLILGGLILFLWCTWHLKRMRMLGDVSAFEIACSDAQIDASNIAPAGHATPEVGIPYVGRDAVTPGKPLGAAEDLGLCVRQIRGGLLSFLPRRDTLMLLAAMALLTPWIMEQSSRSIDTAILGPVMGWGRLPSAFDLLFGFLVFTALSLIAWTLRRLVAVWASLRQCLRHVDALPLGDAFERLPAPIAALARFTPFNAPSDSAVNLTIDRAAYARWLELRKAKARLPESLRRWLPRRMEGAFPSLRTESSRFDLSIAGPLIAMHRALARTAHNDALYMAALHSETPTAAGGARGPGGTVGSVQELIALYVIDYVEWVVRHLRQLAFYLIACLTLTMIFISSYPFTPASVVRVIFFTLMALSVIAIATILFQMNRNSTLSRIGHTTAGEITWDTQFILSLLLVTGVPLLTIISAEFPGVREFLFAWVTPALKAVAKT